MSLSDISFFTNLAYHEGQNVVYNQTDSIPQIRRENRSKNHVRNARKSVQNLSAGNRLLAMLLAGALTTGGARALLHGGNIVLGSLPTALGNVPANYLDARAKANNPTFDAEENLWDKYPVFYQTPKVTREEVLGLVSAVSSQPNGQGIPDALVHLNELKSEKAAASVKKLVGGDKNRAKLWDWILKNPELVQDAIEINTLPSH